MDINCCCIYKLGKSDILREPLSKPDHKSIEDFVNENAEKCFENHNKVLKIPIQFPLKGKAIFIYLDELLVFELKQSTQNTARNNENEKKNTSKKKNSNVSEHFLNHYLEKVLHQDIVKSLRELDLESFVLNGFYLNGDEVDILILLPKVKLIINIEAKRGYEKNCLKNLWDASKQCDKHLKTIRQIFKSDWKFVKAACLAAAKKNMKLYANESYPEPCDTCLEFILWKEDIYSGT